MYTEFSQPDEIQRQLQAGALVDATVQRADLRSLALASARFHRVDTHHDYSYRILAKVDFGIPIPVPGRP